MSIPLLALQLKSMSSYSLLAGVKVTTSCQPYELNVITTRGHKVMLEFKR